MEFAVNLDMLFLTTDVSRRPLFPFMSPFFRMTENNRQKWPWKKERAFDTVKTAGVEIHTL